MQVFYVTSIELFVTQLDFNGILVKGIEGLPEMIPQYKPTVS